MNSNDYNCIEVFNEPVQGIRYTSGSNVMNECLCNGRYLCNFRSAHGKLKSSWVMQWNDISWVKDLIGISPVEGFILEIDGQALKSYWQWVGCNLINEQEKSHAVIELKNMIRPVSIKIHTRCDGTQFIERWIEITNTGEKPAALSRISPLSGMLWQMPNYKKATKGQCQSIYSLGHFNDASPSREGNLIWKPLENGEFSNINKSGRSGWGVPYFFLRNQINSENFICHLEWSCNWKFSFQVDQETQSSDSRIFFSMEPFAPSPQKIIAPGETIISPVVHLAHISGDIDQCVNETYRHIRRSAMLTVSPERRLMIGQGRVVTGDEKFMLDQIDIAEGMRMEFFEFDAGWYGRDSRNWWQGRRGDWDVHNWNANGFDQIRETIHDKGMAFGLWMELEAMGHESNLKITHPDWEVCLDGVPVSKGAGDGSLLNLSDDAVAQWIESEVMRVITEYRPDYFKIDYNFGFLGEEGNCVKDGFIENTQWGHVKALYRIYDRIHREFPDIILENCAAGGGRNDLGMVRRTHISCQSDFTEQPANLLGLNGLTFAYPPELLRHYYPMQKDYSLFGDTDYHFRVMMLSNPFFIEVIHDAHDKGDLLVQKYDRYVDLYKSFVRNMLVVSKVYHHTPFANMNDNNDWCVLEYAAENSSCAMVALFRNYAQADSGFIFRARGMNASFRYAVTFDNDGIVVEMDGYQMISEGIPVRLECAMSSQLLIINKI